MDGMIDLGKPMGEAIAVEPGSGKQKKMSYPCLYVPIDLVGDKTVGDMCRFEIVGKIVGLREDEASIDVQQAKYIGKAGKATKDEYKGMTDAEREAHDKKVMEQGDAEEDDTDEAE